MTDRRFLNHQNLNERGVLLQVDCRFCRLQEKYDKYAHIAPCGCAGPTRYVHRDCLHRWVVVKFEHVYNHPHNGDPEEFNTFCEVCQQRMEIEFVVTNKLSKYQDFIEKIIARKLLFSTILLLATGLLVAIIILAIYTSHQTSSVPPKFIFALSFCCVAMVVVVVVFICSFIVIKSIEIEHIGSNKNPMIMGIEANLDSVEDEEEGSQKDPYFGVQASKKQAEVDKSLMLESKRDSGSVVSKTLTDLVMQKMYKHDEVSLKGKSEKSLNDSKFNRISRHSRLPVKETRDQEVQISSLERRQGDRVEKSIQHGINQLDQEIQHSRQLNNQSIQASRHNRDASVQPSFLPRTRRIFREDTSIVPPSSVADHDKQAMPSPKKAEKVFISEVEQSVEPRMEYIRPTPLDENGSSGESKKSEEQLVKQVANSKRHPSPDTKLKLKTLKDPIKIRVMF